jgi:hypothetical protein
LIRTAARLRWAGVTKEARRLSREKRTMQTMVAMYCAAHHGSGAGVCADCAELLAYALERLGKCPFGAGKPTCANCTIHCYKPDRREAARRVMRYAGPRMLWRHPFLALMHLLDGRRRTPRRGRADGRAQS